jgi:hypothetical protein
MTIDFSILDNPKFTHVVEHYRKACAASRRHSEVAEIAFSKYGEHGPQISGCVRDHFPSSVKDELRMLARECSESMDAARACRPKYVQTETIAKIGRLVATQDGCGFYGPSKIREGES